MRNAKSMLGALVASVFLGASGAVHAGYFASTLTVGSNTYEDQSREAYVDVNQNGLFDVTDVLVGFVRLDNKSKPNPLTLSNQVYLIFTQQVSSVNGDTVFWEPTTTTGLTLKDLGIASAGSSDMMAVVSKAGGFSKDLITTSPGERTGSTAITLKDYFDLLTDEGVVEMIAGMSDKEGGLFCNGGSSDCFTADSSRAGDPNAGFIGLPDSITVASFVAGLEVSKDPDGFAVNDSTPSGLFDAPAVDLSVSEMAINNGAARGYANVVNSSEWTNTSELTSLKQCSVNGGESVACGFVDKADFTIDVSRVPEPATLGLLGISLLGMAAVRRRRP